MKASFKKYILHFKRPSGTSRGIMTQKETWFLILSDEGKAGIGECGLLRGLSVDDVPEYKQKLQWVCNNIHLGKTTLLQQLVHFPSIQFGVEQAFLSLQSSTPFELFPSAFTQKNDPISINGLIWMGDEHFMLSQVEKKLEEGFNCIKMKIGAIDFETELKIIKSIRTQFSADEIELRVDANGAFAPNEALEKLDQLSAYDLHSIEQPIIPGHWEVMAKLCGESPLPIALDEELIGIFGVTEKRRLLQTIRPQYIILKPSLVGGIQGSTEWIDLAEAQGTGWWVTSALESNIGLSAISQWTFMLDTTMPQGLGTGGLFTNNFESPLEVKDGKLYHSNTKKWDINVIENLCT